MIYFLKICAAEKPQITRLALTSYLCIYKHIESTTTTFLSRATEEVQTEEDKSFPPTYFLHMLHIPASK